MPHPSAPLALADELLSRRAALKALGLATTVWIWPDSAVRAAAPSLSTDRAVILIVLTGGPSQLDTFDPKPDAPAEIRGPFDSIATAVPGVRVCEHLPLLALRLDRVTLLRTLQHDLAPIHETGLQLLQTGQFRRLGVEAPHAGALAAARLGPRGDQPPFVVLPFPLGNMGVSLSKGQSAGWLGPDWEPVVLQPSRADVWSDAYGPTTFGQSCCLAVRLVEQGTRFVVVNMYDTVFHRVSWDCHGRRPFSTLDDYAREVLPTFDRAFSALLDDLKDLGLFDSVLVVASGEFGRAPRRNTFGGRDHWTRCWTALLAGGGLPGGQVVGESDPHAAEPIDQPITPAELLATI